MSRVYDNWEKLVGAVLNREELKRLALSESFSSSISADFSSRFDSSTEDVHGASRIYGETVELVAQSYSCQSIVPYRGVQLIKFKEIRNATKNFRGNMIGEGAFGLVYKGWIDKHTLTASNHGSGMAVAIKRRNQESFHGYREWLPCRFLQKEINYLSQLHHPNLVRLIGCSCDEHNLILVHEFIPGGSLENHLFGRGHQSLSWAIRMKVAVGAARGLSFLHELATSVVHRGCHSGNILLDGEFNAKLSDFGVAREGPDGSWTHGTTEFMITSVCGYAAPEYIKTGHLTTKSNVFSFGVILLQLLSGRRVIDTNLPMEERNLVNWAHRNLLGKRKFLPIMDAKLEGQYDHYEAYVLAMLASVCLLDDPKSRPTMADIVFTLEHLRRRI